MVHVGEFHVVRSDQVDRTGVEEWASDQIVRTSAVCGDWDEGSEIYGKIVLPTFNERVTISPNSRLAYYFRDDNVTPPMEVDIEDKLIWPAMSDGSLQVIPGGYLGLRA